MLPVGHLPVVHEGDGSFVVSSKCPVLLVTEKWFKPLSHTSSRRYSTEGDHWIVKKTRCICAVEFDPFSYATGSR